MGGLSVDSIVAAVPSTSGLADVFAVHSGGVQTVQAIASDGTTAWSAQFPDGALPDKIIPDFQGGLIDVHFLSNTHGSLTYSMTKVDGITGQNVSTYTTDSSAAFRVHPLIIPAGGAPNRTV
jgi:hypothetical protein